MAKDLCVEYIDNYISKNLQYRSQLFTQLFLNMIIFSINLTFVYDIHIIFYNFDQVS